MVDTNLLLRLRWSRHWYIVLLLAVLTACGGAQDEQLLFNTVAKDIHLPRFAIPSNASSEVIVFDNQGDVDRFILTHVGISEPELSAFPGLDPYRQNDYAAQVIVIVKAPAGYSSVAIEQVLHRENRVLLIAKLVQPPQFGGREGVSTEPYHGISLPRSSVAGRQLTFQLIDVDSWFGRPSAEQLYTFP